MLFSRFRSLRWQLPASYAGIALLAVVSLGLALLGTLYSFYREQELAYLRNNAVVIAEEIAPLLVADEQALLASQVAGFSFLTQTRIEVLGASGDNVLADSGESGTFVPAISVGLADDLLGSFVEEETVIVVEEQRRTESGGISNQRVMTRTSRLPTQGALYGFNLGQSPTAVTERSNLAVETAIMSEPGVTLGIVRLSQGPAVGRGILRSVAAGWAIAGVVAILLAMLAGWLVSRRLTRPLLALTAVTGRMAAGDLGARAEVNSANEVGQLGNAFNNMAAQVESTVQSLRQFTADAAHELHTPLTALQTDLQLLETGEDTTQQQRVARAQQQAERLQILADSLLQLSRLEAAIEDDEQRLLDLTELIQMTGELVASQAEQASLSFTMHLPDKPLLIRGNGAQLQSALLNVLDNSVKFTPSSGEIVVGLSGEGDTAVVTIRDTGIGIPPEDMPQLFRRFHRGRNTAEYAGSGLGLAITEQIIAQHHGRVIVNSGQQGTEVKMILPTVASV